MCLSQGHGEGDGDASNKEALARFKMIDARLRRLCEKKPSGKTNVPDAVHKQWAAGGKERDELRKMFEQYECDKETQIFTNINFMNGTVIGFTSLMHICILHLKM